MQRGCGQGLWVASELGWECCTVPVLTLSVFSARSSTSSQGTQPRGVYGRLRVKGSAELLLIASGKSEF